MRLGSPIRPDLDLATSLEEADKNIVSALNINFSNVYTALQQNLSLTDNFKGKQFQSFFVKHGEDVVITHKIGQTVSNLIILGGDYLARGIVITPGRSSSTCKFFLPAAVVLSSSGNDLYVSDPSGFKIGTVVNVGENVGEIVEIDGNKISMKNSVSSTDFKTTIYVASANLNFFLF